MWESRYLRLLDACSSREMNDGLDVSVLPTSFCVKHVISGNLHGKGSTSKGAKLPVVLPLFPKPVFFLRISNKKKWVT